MTNALPFSTKPHDAAGSGCVALIQQAQQAVRLSRALAGTGRAVDLAGLDQLMGAACAQALNLPHTDGLALRPLLAALLAECDALGRTLHLSPRQKAAPCPYPPHPC